MLADLLHCFHLGVLNRFATDLVWEMILCDVWVRKITIAPDHLQLSIAMPEGDLQAWYSKEHDLDPTERNTGIQSLEHGMFGTQNARKLSLKAVETKMFFLFLGDTLRTNSRKVNRADIWCSCHGSLVRFMEILREQPLVVATTAMQDPMHM